jgi:hypothetical protein
MAKAQVELAVLVIILHQVSQVKAALAENLQPISTRDMVKPQEAQATLLVRAVADLFGMPDSHILPVGELEAQLELFGAMVDIIHQQIQQTYKREIKWENL